jgi:YhcH/YjgK/YiaL family protein
MIADKINNAVIYRGLSGRMRKALDLLQDPSLAEKGDGRYEVEGDDIFYMIQRYSTKTKDQAGFEAHKEYIDVQAILDGEETIGCADAGSLETAEPYKPDIVRLKAPPVFSEIYLPAGTFAVFFPTDAHMPCYHHTPSRVTKLVIKVKVGAGGPDAKSG